MRHLWLQPAKTLNLDVLIERIEWLRRFPELQEIIDWIQELREWFERRYAKPARAALQRLIDQAKASAIEPLKSVAGSISRWFDPIVNFSGIATPTA